MNKKEKKRQVLKQLNEMIPDIKNALKEKINKAFNSGAIPDEFYEDDYLLIKAIIDSWCKDRGYNYRIHSHYQKLTNNLHKYL